MDVDSLVKQMMKARRANYDKMYQNKTLLEWKKSDYYNIYTSINNFRSTTAFNYKLDTTLVPKLSSSSSESVATAKANAEAANVSHTLKVNQLAEGVKMTSTGTITTGADKTMLSHQFGITGDPFLIKITNGSKSAEIAVDPTKSIYDLVAQINNAGVNVRANYDAEADRFYMFTTDSGSAAGIDFTGSDTKGMDLIFNKLKMPAAGHADTTGMTSSASLGAIDTLQPLATQFAGLSGSFTLKLVNGDKTATVTIDTAVDSMDDMRYKINHAGVTADDPVGVGAQAGFDGSKFTLKAASGTLDLTGSDAAAFSFLSNQLKLSEHGKDAKITLDGVDYTKSSNNFSISGVNYTLKNTGTTTIGISNDIETAVDSVKTFVDAYNKLLDQVNKEVTEAKYKDFKPLTDDQKKEMKESDIKAWEEKAKSGTLRGDTTLRELINNMRANVSEPIKGVNSKYNSAASIGITTGSYLEGGKLYFNETKLRTALQEDPDVLKNLFGSDGDNGSKDGIAVRLYDSLKTATDKIAREGGASASALYDTKSNLGKGINDYAKQMANMATRLQEEEDRYYKQFSAMEQYISNMNKQSSWLSQQFSS